MLIEAGVSFTGVRKYIFLLPLREKARMRGV
jgi:hypothetical protein